MHNWFHFQLDQKILKRLYWVMKGGKRKSLGISWCPFATITIAVLGSYCAQ
jgi:hypothetical protein